ACWAGRCRLRRSRHIGRCHRLRPRRSRTTLLAMATTLERFTDAYATMTVAVYEPLVIRWVSGYSIHVLASTLAWRAQKAPRLSENGGLPTAQLINTASYRTPLPDLSSLPSGPPAPPRPIHDTTHATVPAEHVEKLKLKGFPDAVMI